jgi:hypothetical protein
MQEFFWLCAFNLQVLFGWNQLFAYRRPSEFMTRASHLKPFCQTQKGLKASWLDFRGLKFFGVTFACNVCLSLSASILIGYELL